MPEVVEVIYAVNGTTQTDQFQGRVREVQVFDTTSGDGGRAVVHLDDGYEVLWPGGEQVLGGPVKFVGYAQAYRVVRRPSGGSDG